VVSVKSRATTDIESEEIIVRSLSGPTCISTSIDNGNIVYTIEKELGVELVGDTKVKIQVDEEEEPWDSLDDEEVVNVEENEINRQIDEEVNEDYLK